MIKQDLELLGHSSYEKSLVRGADTTNAFAEANAQDIISLYIRVDDQYYEWHNHKFNIDNYPNFVLLVHKALQGHSEHQDCGYYLWKESSRIDLD